MAWWVRRPWALALAVSAICEALFLFRLSVPAKPVFDEVHYLPAARTLMELARPANVEHPLLAKVLVAAGMVCFGDTPFGWRVAATLAGSATVAGAFALALVLTGRTRAGLFAAALGVLGFTIYIQARIAMLDTFMLAFLVWGIVVLAWSMGRRGHGAWIGGAALLGLATACKWSAGLYVAAAAVTFIVMKRGHPARWRDVSIVGGLALLGGVSVACYFATFAPAFFYADQPLTWRTLLPFQLEMYARQTQVLPPHTYQSDWWSWPLMLRPIWYLYEPVDGAQRGIMFVGNPVVMWGGLVAVAALFWAWVRTGATRLLAPAMLWTFSIAIFAAIPKSLGFLYYYYPSTVFLCVALAVAFDHWRDAARGWDELFLLAAFALALYFLPVLSAEPLSDAGAFRRWTWFDSWV